MKKTNIGGQAVVEGVMMRGKNMYAMAVRNTATKEIGVLEKDLKPVTNKFFKLPLIRGCYSFISAMVVGMDIISKSVEMAGLEEEEESSKFEKWLTEKFGEKLNSIIMGISVVLALIISVSLFMVLPTFLASFVNRYTNDNTYILSIVEGFTRLGIFILYILLISQNNEIKRLFKYHGAEHKTINCYEAEKELTVENVKNYSRFHKRCGTSFLVFIMIISMIFFMVVRTDDIVIRVISRIAFVPLIAGVSYEILRFAGKHDNKFVDIISMPGVWFQKITTKEPEDEQIEVAIKAMNAVLEREGDSA